jgi:uncharacterized protein YbjT (DUF2867 family)
MSTRTIAVHGASGTQGAPVVTALEAAGHTVRPLTRATGVDLLDPDALVAAYRGADAVVLQFPLVYDERALRMAENAARAAEAAGVTHLVVNASAPMPPVPVGVPFVDARHVAAAAAVERVTVLQPTTYMENLTAPWSAARLAEDGVLAYPVPGDAPMAFVAADDLAAAIARALEDEVVGWFALPGEPTTGHAVAEAFTEVLGRPVRWEHIVPDAYADLLRPFLGDHAADGTAAVYREAAPGPAPDPAPARAALGWAPRALSAWLYERERSQATAAM